MAKLATSSIRVIIILILLEGENRCTFSFKQIDKASFYISVYKHTYIHTYIDKASVYMYIYIYIYKKKNIYIYIYIYIYAHSDQSLTY